MNQSKSGAGVPPSAARQFLWIALCLAALLAVLFRDGLRPGHTVFSNDGPLGAISSQSARLPAGFFGYWGDLNWLGGTGPSASPDISQGLALLTGPLLFSKIYAPFTLLFLGLSAWLCFREWKFSPRACFLGSLAVALNSDFFSTACWGVAAQPLSFGLDFLALAALADLSSPRRWLRAALAGLAVGLGVMEAFDIGAIFSLVIAGFVLWQAWAGEGTRAQRAARGVGRLAVVAAFAAFVAASAVSTLVGTQIKGVAGMGQDQASKAQRWDAATQWSMPKRETLSLFVPGLFGYRMDTPMNLPEGLQNYYLGGCYWGAGGRHPEWDRYFAAGKPGPPPSGFIRYGGGGVYAGTLVVLVALWTMLQALRREQSVFSRRERKFIGFWSGVTVIAFLVGLGRFAPFYQFFYALPFASTIRNPAKFFHVVDWALVILFACGLHGLSRSFLDAPGAALRELPAQLRTWWARAGRFEKNWARGSALALAAAGLAWLIYAQSRPSLETYLQEVQFDAGMAREIAGFSIRQAGVFLVLFTLALGLMLAVVSGYFSGRRARLGGILLGVLLVADLGWANMPWVISWNWQQKYATNPVIDLLRDKPYEHRVAVLPFVAPREYALFHQLYEIEWKQQLFPYYNIQSLDIVMMPRAPVEFLAYESALGSDGTPGTRHRVARRWQLTNTRYLLGAASYLSALNRELDPAQNRFRIATRFDIETKPGIDRATTLETLTAVIKPDGPYAVFEFTGVLPRAKLYANWQVSTNDQATLTTLGSTEFDPAQQVLLADPLPAPDPLNATNPNPGTVEFASYAPKQIVLQAKAETPAVLLLNDKYDPNWQVSVDGKAGKLLRCNYLMRGVYLPPGSHTVEFRFAPPTGILYVSLTALAVTVLLLVCLVFPRLKEPAPPPSARKPSKPGKPPG